MSAGPDELARIAAEASAGAQRHADRMALIERCGPLVNLTEADLARYLRWAERDERRARAAVEIDPAEWGGAA